MKKLVIVLLSIVLLTGCSAADNSVVTSNEVTSQETPAAQTTKQHTEITIQTEAVTEAPPAEPKTVSFCAVGDNLIHSPIYNQARIRNTNGYDFSAAYSEIADIIKEADLAVINQETLICNDMYEPSNYPRFNSPVALGDYMVELGFDVFTLANNHCLDYGAKGLSYSLDYWESRNALTSGVYRNEADKNNIRTTEYGGITFSFLSYTESLNGLSLPADSELVIGNANDLDGMISDIKAAKAISDVCVIAMHWGVEGSDIIENRQREYAQTLAEAGADIIIGNHPHVLRDIEMIPHEGGETLCAYSLGNFISAQNIGKNLISGILEFNVTLTEESSSPIISDIKLTPIVTHYDSGYSKLRLYKLSNYTPELAAAHGVRQYSTFSYDYIIDVLKNSVNEQYLVLP